MSGKYQGNIPPNSEPMTWREMMGEARRLIKERRTEAQTTEATPATLQEIWEKFWENSPNFKKDDA